MYAPPQAAAEEEAEDAATKGQGVDAFVHKPEYWRKQVRSALGIINHTWLFAFPQPSSPFRANKSFLILFLGAGRPILPATWAKCRVHW